MAFKSPVRAKCFRRRIICRLNADAGANGVGHRAGDMGAWQYSRCSRLVLADEPSDHGADFLSLLQPRQFCVAAAAP